MRDRLSITLDTADLAIASCSGVLDSSDMERVKTTVAALRLRLSYPDDVLVVALAGGTGSGKSSLFNALGGADMAEVGGVRPTTGAPEAAIPDGVGEGLDGYLEFLDVRIRHTYAGTGLCLIDLPDTDSVEVSHRHQVDSLLPFVDVVLWVTDPEKYRDARLHDDYLRPLAGYSSQFVCVLNRRDRLDTQQLQDVTADFSAALAEAGLAGVPVVPTAASPPIGPSLGITDLSEVLQEMRSAPATLYGKLLTDLESSVTDLSESLGAVPVEFDDLASDAAHRAAAAIADGDVEGATKTLVGFLDSLSVAARGCTAASLARLNAEVPQHVTRVVGETRRREPTRRWLRRRADHARPDADIINAALSEAIVRPARAILAKRAVAIASVAELAVDVAGLRSGLSR